MLIQPKTWTSHHIQRLYHISMLASFVFIVVAVIWGIFTISLQGQAFDIVQQSDQGISATVPGIDSGPIVITNNTAGAANYYNPNDYASSTSAKSSKPQTPALQIIANGAKTIDLVINGNKLSLLAFDTQNPSFSGNVGIKNAIIFLEVHAAQIIRSTTYADSQGNWSWQSPEAILPGIHTLLITAEDPENPAIMVSGSLDFYIMPGSPVKQPAQNNLRPNTIIPNNGGNLFDVLVKIPQEFKTMAPGDDLVTSIKLINFGSAGNPVDVEVQYTIEDSQGGVILQSSETVAVATQLSFLKTFSTNPDLKTGSYKITVRVPSKDLIAASADSFDIKGVPIIALGSYGKIDFTLIFQALLAMLFLFSLVVYFEYNKVNVLTNIINKVSEDDLRLYNK